MSNETEATGSSKGGTPANERALFDIIAPHFRLAARTSMNAGIAAGYKPSECDEMTAKLIGIALARLLDATEAPADQRERFAFLIENGEEAVMFMNAVMEEIDNVEG